MNGEAFAAMDETIRILLVEDVPADAELIVDELRDDGLDCVVRRVDTEADYLAGLETFAPDIVLSDLGLPEFDGYRALQLLRERKQLLPFIFVSGTMGEDVAVEALRQGATDYILKNNTARLAAAVRRALREAAEQRSFRRIEAELIRAQRFESLALLAGGLSHDLRNLLQPLLLAADTLDDYRDDARLGRLGDLVRGCGRRGLDMVSSMLTFARGARRAEQVRVGSLFDALGLLLQGSVPRTVTLTIDAAVPDLEFEGNHTELQQCLLNLSLNALQAMPGGGRLQVGADRVTLDESFFDEGETVAPGDYLQLTVSDTGEGMSPTVKANLFQPFFTTKSEGTGLGLLSCKRIVASHEGVLRVDSEPGTGTRFRIYLPLRVAEAVAQPADVLPQGRGEHVLVVVEKAAELSLLADTLDAYGYDVRTRQSGAAALQSLESDGLPQLVVMDADMNLLTGVRTLAALLEHSYGGAVLLLAHPEAPPELDGLPPLPHLRVLDKPVQTDALLCAVRASLDAADADG
jgi:signal transduction histidine kinase